MTFFRLPNPKKVLVDLDDLVSNYYRYGIFRIDNNQNLEIYIHKSSIKMIKLLTSIYTLYLDSSYLQLNTRVSFINGNLREGLIKVLENYIMVVYNLYVNRLTTHNIKNFITKFLILVRSIFKQPILMYGDLTNLLYSSKNLRDAIVSVLSGDSFGNYVYNSYIDAIVIDYEQNMRFNNLFLIHELLHSYSRNIPDSSKIFVVDNIYTREFITELYALILSNIEKNMLRYLIQHGLNVCNKYNKYWFDSPYIAADILYYIYGEDSLSIIRKIKMDERSIKQFINKSLRDNLELFINKSFSVF